MTTDARPRRNYLPDDRPAVDLAGIVRLRDFEAPARERIHPAAWAYYAGGAYDEHVLATRSPRGTRSGCGRACSRTCRGSTLTTTILGRPGRAADRHRPRGAPRPRAPRRRARDGARRRRRPARSTSCRRSPATRSRRSPRRRPAAGAGSSCTSSATARVTRALVERAAAAGYEALVPHGRPARPRLPRRGPPPAVRSGRGRLREPPEARRLAIRRPTSTRRWTCAASDLTWDALEEIRSWAPLPLVLKGILTARGRPARRGARRRRRLGQQPRRPAARPGRRGDRRAGGDRGRGRGARRGVPRRRDPARSGDPHRARARRAAPCSRRGRSCGRSRPAARPAWRMASTILREELERGLRSSAHRRRRASPGRTWSAREGREHDGP